MLDEASGVGACVRPGAQPHFDGSERAYGTEPGLHDYDTDGSQMGEPKVQRIDPAPGEQIASDNDDKAAADEHDDGEVQCEHDIGEQLIWQRVVYTGCLIVIQSGCGRYAS